jgi:hypothetical protein
MTTNPNILVPLPIAVVGLLDPSTPLRRNSNADLTPFLDEWATLLLDPVQALEDRASDHLDLCGWQAAGWAQVSTSVVRLLRDAARREAVIVAMVKHDPALAVRRVESGQEVVCLDPLRALPKIAGLAVATALWGRVGKESRRVWTEKKRADHAARQAAERRSVSEASEAASERLGSPGLD